MPDLYDTDFVAWAEEQAALLREGRFEALDLEQLIQEVEDLAGNYQDALQSQMQRLLTHLLKLEVSPKDITYSTGSSDPQRLWKLSVQDARNQIQKHLHRHRSLNARLQGEYEFSYPYAVKDAHNQLAVYGDTHAPFPESCPWTLEQVLDEAFWPER